MRHPPTRTIHRNINIGRNDPCYCGSGKKFKKCCFLKIKPSVTQLAKREQAKEDRYYLKKYEELKAKHSGKAISGKYPCKET